MRLLDGHPQHILARYGAMLLLALAALAPVVAADWPAYLHDTQRSAVTDETPAFPLKPVWQYACAQPPAPAWPEQLSGDNRVDFDYAPQPVIADGLLCFGSSADDTVRALDAATGRERWHFVTGGPVRVAPQIADGKVYFGSDDGIVYCLNAADGAPVWIFRPGPADERMVGNHRMISRWPVRTGVLVVDEIAYCVGGMWNVEGVFIYALQADTGKVLWCNDTTNLRSMSLADFVGLGINGQHQGEFGAGGTTPQGPLVANQDVLLVPNGYGFPTPLNRHTGKPIFWHPYNAPGAGGTWMTINGDNLYCFAKHGQSGNNLCLYSYPLTTGKAVMALGPSQVPQLAMGPQLRPSDLHEQGKVSALVHDGAKYARQAYRLVLAGDKLILGKDGAVTAEETVPKPLADVRFAVASDQLAISLTVTDHNVHLTKYPYEGSCFEVFGSLPGTGPIGQVFLTPAMAETPAKAYRLQNARIDPEPGIRVESQPLENGYALQALIPLAMLNLNATAGKVLLEFQVTATTADGMAEQVTFFGSKKAYQDSSRFGVFRLPVGTAAVKLAPGERALAKLAAIENPGKVKDALAAQKPLSVKTTAQREIWRASVEGEARELAVANGQLYVATREGKIYCFAPATDGPPVVHDPGAIIRAQAAPAIPEAITRVVEQVRQAGADRGFVLVLGDPDGQLSMALAQKTSLRIVSAQADAAAVARLRERLLDRTTWYGSRIAVQTVARLDRLPFAQFFANTIIVTGPVQGLSGKELYRVLHPCGGTLFCPGLTPEAAAVLMKESGAPAEEIRQEADGVRLVRGKLPGALDWDTKLPAADQRVKWPLRPLWFGGPATGQIRNYRQGADGPVVANGRYFIMGEDSLTAVDAYNGAILWTRPIPKAWPDIRMAENVMYPVTEANPYSRQDLGRGSMRVNDDAVYLRLGKGYFRGQDAGYIQIDARTGTQQKIYGPFIPPTAVSLTAPQIWPVEVDAAHAGTVTLAQTPQGLVVTLATKDPVITSLDAWELFFDFRAPDARYGLYDHGAFSVRVTPARDAQTPAAWVPDTGTDIPTVEVAGTREAGGTRTVLTLPWTGLQTLVGAKPAGFGFAVTLNTHDGGRTEPIVRRHLFGDWTADGLNNGWAAVSLDGTPPVITPPAVIAGTIQQLKDRTGVIGNGGRSLSDAVRLAPRINPLTGEPELKVYRPSTLCGASFFSDYVMSGRAGIYDFADDSGLRFVGGLKSRCTSPQVVALGMILISEETGHCSCNYPFRTTLAMAPAERRLNEDWALFHDQPADTRIRQAAINLGAPGDRRDDNGTLWLGFPRLPGDKAVGYSLAAGTQTAISASGVWMRFVPGAFQVPLTVDCFGGDAAYSTGEDSETYSKWMTVWVPNRFQKALGPQRVNADRVAIAKTDRPWIYASNIRGIRRAALKLDFIKPLASLPCDRPPQIDGKLDEPLWTGDPQGMLPFTKTRVFLRHDGERLYIAARRPAVIDRLGKTSPWTKTATGENAAVWADDSFEVFLADPSGSCVAHLGVAASGARYDALAAADAETEDKAWDGIWTSAVIADDAGLTFEIAIPWKTLADTGLTREQLAVNVQINQKDVSGEANIYPGYLGRNYNPKDTSGEALCNLGLKGRTRCEHFVPLGIGAPAAFPPRTFTVRLHFCELDDTPPGTRVFDVKLQGQTVLKDFDIAREAGIRTALLKEFTHIPVGEALTVEFIPKNPEVTAATAPILSALELFEDGFTPTTVADR